MSSARLPEILRPFSREYHEVSGCEVMRVMMVHPAALREYVDAGYVAYLEVELKKARKDGGVQAAEPGAAVRQAEKQGVLFG